MAKILYNGDNDNENTNKIMAEMAVMKKMLDELSDFLCISQLKMDIQEQRNESIHQLLQATDSHSKLFQNAKKR